MKGHLTYSYDFKTYASCLLAIFIFLCVLPAWAVVQAAGTDNFVIIKIRNRLAKELLPQVQTVLSPSGHASVDTISNAIIVSDEEEQVGQITQLIKQLDVRVPQVTVHLRYNQATTRTRSFSTAGGISGGRDGLRLSSGTMNRQKNLQLTVSSGSSGYLLVGRDIPFTSAWLDLCYGHGYRFSWLTEYQRVSSGFEVQPVVIGSRVDLTLIPRLSFKEKQEIRFSEAATRVTIPANTWVVVAASDMGMNAVSAAILTANGQTNDRAMVMEVMASVR